MPDLEKTIRGLECCTMPNNEGVDKCKEYKCPYRKDDDDTCIWHLMDDALSLLKAQEPRLLKPEDFDDNPPLDESKALPAWVEY